MRDGLEASPRSTEFAPFGFSVVLEQSTGNAEPIENVTSGLTLPIVVVFIRA